MRNPIQATRKTTFFMSQETAGPWKSKWAIHDSNTGRVHRLVDTEQEADAIMDGIMEAVEANKIWES